MSDASNPKRVDQMLIDRLVDGELVGDEYREALARIELAPDGWKQCAMSFLEAQAWQRDLADFLEENPANVVADVKSPQAKPPRLRKHPMRGSGGGSSSWKWPIPGPYASVAAMVLVFLIGWLLPPPRNTPSPPTLAAPSPLQSLTRPASHHSPSGQIELAVDGQEHGQRQFQVPFYSPEQYSTPGPLEVDQWVNFVAHEGAQVSRHRAVYPEELNDRESVLVPIEFISVDTTGDFQ